MIQLLLFCLALGASVYGALTGNVLSLVLATVTAAITFSRLSGHPLRQSQLQSMLMHSILRHGWLIVSFFAVLFAVLATIQARQNPFDRQCAYAWLASLLLMITAGYVHDYRQKQMIAGKREGASNAKERVTFDRLDWCIAVGITLGALALRLYRLDDFLPTMHGDEGEMGLLALLALHGPTSGISPMPLPLFSTAFLDHPTLFHYVQAAALWLFGESLQGLRLLSVVVGALCATVVYAIGRLGWGRVGGTAAAWLLAVSHFHLQYSRIALNNIETVLLTALFVLFMIMANQAIHRQEGTDEAGAKPRSRHVALVVPYLWAGLTMGISQYFYYGSRLLPVIAVPFLLFLWWKRRLGISQVLILVLATLVTYAPLASHYSQSLPAFINRTKGVSVFNPTGMAHTLGAEAIWPQDLPLLIGEQIKRNAAFFVKDGDRSAFYFTDVGAFDPITVALFWLGLGVVLARVSRFPEFTLLVWFGLGFFLAGVATNDAPNGPRLVVITTTVYLISGVLLQRLWNFAHRIWPNNSRWGAIIVASLLAIGTLQLNYTAYFEKYARYTPNMLAISMAHTINQLDADSQVYIFGAPYIYADYSTLRFVSRQAERRNVETAAQLPTYPVEGATGRSMLIMALANHLTDLTQAMARLPGGIREDHFDRVGNLMYVTYFIAGKQEEGRTGTNNLPGQANTISARSPLPNSPLLPPLNSSTPKETP